VRSEGALRGFANSVKGIFHEELFAQRLNDEYGAGAARLYESPTHPAADIEIKLPGEGEAHPLQLKAVATADPVNHHLASHPDVPVAVTHEMAWHFDNPHVVDSGFSNRELTADTNGNIHALETHTLANRAASTAELAAAVASAAEVMQMLRGEREFPDAVLNVVAKTGVSAGAMVVTALLFG
jgi:hypothetical protein